ncbi:amidohydrolase family protein [Paraburkholderia sp. J67]|uniref:amidohydrolase family protein n=1 Tax=Paraburkholderia sp. J67 TaxID=2805435 RepID=UPI002ABE342A|nr:amidohydrolase family protein [Paraburkholderia sp. J67]
MKQEPNRIDVHHHLIPPVFVKTMHDRGRDEVAGAKLPTWTAELSIENMDMHGIATAILSLSAPGVNFGGPLQARDLARACNEFAAETVNRYPGRFGAFAVLPMPFTDDACREAVYALDELGADGVVLLGSTDGYFLGDERFDELMSELNRRETVVFVHPNLHSTSSELGLSTPGFLVEFLCDTTRAATNLIFSGTLEKYPKIRWILAHAGGFLPYIAWRLSLANGMPEMARKAPRGVLHYVRNFYYDTALSPSPYALAALSELVEPKQILFGSDYPFAPAVVSGIQTKSLAELKVISEDVKSGIDRAHALALFPRFAVSDAVNKTHVGGHVKQALTQGVEALADIIRER